jgi:hypothetical protein
MNDLFGSAPLDAAAWLEILAVALVAYTIVELAKLPSKTQRGWRRAPH